MSVFIIYKLHFGIFYGIFSINKYIEVNKSYATF